MPTIPQIPSDISFQAAIGATQQLLDVVATLDSSASGGASPGGPGPNGDVAAQIEQAIATLLEQLPGARGFFVAYLTGDHAAADPPHPSILAGLRRSPQQSTTMLTKNLAMSTAMALVHRRQNNAEMAQQSMQVRSRTMALIAALGLPELSSELAQLQAAASDADNAYTPFLQRWNYDAEQRQHIHDAAAAALAQRPTEAE